MFQFNFLSQSFNETRLPVSVVNFGRCCRRRRSVDVVVVLVGNDERDVGNDVRCDVQHFAHLSKAGRQSLYVKTV